MTSYKTICRCIFMSDSLYLSNDCKIIYLKLTKMIKYFYVKNLKWNKHDVITNRVKNFQVNSMDHSMEQEQLH